MHPQRDLFAVGPPLPDGFLYQADFLDEGDETALLTGMASLPLEEARYRTFLARRRVASFGYGYDFSSNELVAAGPLPPFLQPLRARIASLAGISADDFVQTSVTEYRPGAQLGWHRDVPSFGIVAGVSLGTPARMRLRPYPHVKHAKMRALVLELAPRSAYVIRDDARWRWQHAISSTKALRYSITFRTLRRG